MAGQHVPAGAVVLVSPLLLGRQPELAPDDAADLTEFCPDAVAPRRRPSGCLAALRCRRTRLPRPDPGARPAPRPRHLGGSASARVGLVRHNRPEPGDPPVACPHHSRTPGGGPTDDLSLRAPGRVAARRAVTRRGLHAGLDRSWTPQRHSTTAFPLIADHLIDAAASRGRHGRAHDLRPRGRDRLDAPRRTSMGHRVAEARALQCSALPGADFGPDGSSLHAVDLAASPRRQPCARRHRAPAP